MRDPTLCVTPGDGEGPHPAPLHKITSPIKPHHRLAIDDASFEKRLVRFGGLRRVITLAAAICPRSYWIVVGKGFLRRIQPELEIGEL